MNEEELSTEYREWIAMDYAERNMMSGVPSTGYREFEDEITRHGCFHRDLSRTPEDGYLDYSTWLMYMGWQLAMDYIERNSNV
jgi:hypothetical protein